MRLAQTIIPASDRRPELLPATVSIKGLKILTIFNNQPKPYYGSPEVEGQGVAEALSGEDLLSLYLSLPEEKRKQKFANTSEAARMVGLSQRTIQLWIEVGFITAIKIGRKYQVSLDSLRDYLKSRVDY
jgi:excisionase family DNA binding protein